MKMWYLLLSICCLPCVLCLCSGLQENSHIERVPVNAFRGLCTQTISEMWEIRRFFRNIRSALTQLRVGFTCALMNVPWDAPCPLYWAPSSPTSPNTLIAKNCHFIFFFSLSLFEAALNHMQVNICRPTESESIHQSCMCFNLAHKCLSLIDLLHEKWFISMAFFLLTPWYTSICYIIDRGYMFM